MIILKVTKNQGLTLCLEDTIFEKPQSGGQIVPPPLLPAVLGLSPFMYSLPFFMIAFSNFYYDQISRDSR